MGKERKEVTGIRHSFIYSFIQQMVLVLSAGFEVLGLAPIELVFGGDRQANNPFPGNWSKGLPLSVKHSIEYGRSYT